MSCASKVQFNLMKFERAVQLSTAIATIQGSEF